MTRPSPDRLLRAAIVGGGPGGMLAAWQLNQLSSRHKLHVTIYEPGRASVDRVCPRETPRCDCKPTCNILEGRGGAGGWSDGKITLTATRGVHQDPTVFGHYQTALLSQLDALFVEYGIEGSWHDPLDHPPAVVEPLLAKGWTYETYPLRHVGSDGLQTWVKNFSEHLRNNGIFQTGGRVTDIHLTNGRATAIDVEVWSYKEHRYVTETHEVDYLIVASGLSGVPWLEKWADKVGIKTSTGPADIGLRLETPAQHLAPLIDEFYDVKLTHSAPNGLQYRSFCVNGRGYITNEHHRDLGIRGVNGYSNHFEKSERSNMAILAKVTREWCPTMDPKRYVLAVARAVNSRADGYPIKQRLGDFLQLPECFAPRTETPTEPMEPSNIKAVWGDLRSALPDRLYEGFASFIRGIALAAPGAIDPDNVVYGPEIKYYGHSFHVDPTWRSESVGNMFIIGNASGRTASLSAAALAGMQAGREVVQQATAEHGDIVND